MACVPPPDPLRPWDGYGSYRAAVRSLSPPRRKR